MSRDRGSSLTDPDRDPHAGEMSREEWLESDGCKLVAEDLKRTLEGLWVAPGPSLSVTPSLSEPLVTSALTLTPTLTPTLSPYLTPTFTPIRCDELFGPVEKRWIDEYFPFTEPSFELEIFYNGDWMEVLGCGVIHSGVLNNCGLQARHGWAFGLGLERLAMVLFSIPDIRLFWTDDSRFSKQFKAGEITTFKPYSKYPPCFKDISFWIPDGFEPNDFFEIGREVARTP